MEFVDKEAVIYFVECLSKVKNYDVCLGRVIQISSDLISQFDELGLARVFGSKAMLVGGEYLVDFKVSHGVANNNMLHDLAWDAHERNRPVVGWLVVLAFLVHRCYVGHFPT